MSVFNLKSLGAIVATSVLSMAACSDRPEAMPVMPPAIAADGQLTPQQVREDIAIAKEAFERVHPGYTRYASQTEMDAQWQAVIDAADAAGGLSLPEFYLASEEALVAIRCDHTKAELPRSLRDARQGKPLYLPARWTVVEGRALVEVAGEGTGLEFGDEIVSIDGRPMVDVMADIAPYIPVDGYTEWSRAGEIGQSLEFMGGGVDHFGALLWDVSETATLEVQSADGATRNLDIPRVDIANWSALGDASQANFKDAVQFERYGNDVAYVRVDTFVNYRDPVDPDDIFDPIFRAIREEGRGTLIIDLRKNGGGSSGPAYELLANIIDEPFRPIREMRAKTLDLDGIRPYLWTWDARALDPNPLGFSRNDDGTYALRGFVSEDLAEVDPARYAFDGEVIVLTSNSNSSGSTNFVTWVTETGRATTIGERTGGSAEGPTAGLQFTLTLPNSGVRMRLPFFHVLNNVSSFEEGFGISPEVMAPLTVKAFRERRDPALEAALAFASGETVTSAADFASLAGDGWSGELDYLNYGREDRSTIPVRMNISAPEGLSVPYAFLYPGEEDKNADDAITIGADGLAINGLRIVSRTRGEDGSLVLVTAGEGSDDNRPADIRMTYRIADRSFSVAKDVRFQGGGFFNRNRYNLTR